MAADPSAAAPRIAPPSLRLRILLFLALPCLLLCGAVLVLASALIQSQSARLFDEILLQSARGLADRIEIRDGRAEVDYYYFGLSSLPSAPGEKMFYRIDFGADTLGGFGGLPLPEAPEPGPVAFYATDFAGNRLRAVRLERWIADGQVSGLATVVLAESLSGRRAFSARILWILGGSSLLAGAGMLAIALFAVGRGLAPLSSVRAELERRAPGDLDPLPVPAASELVPLVTAINRLMAQIRRHAAQTRQFNADISHELRTPLAEMRTLIDMEEAEPAPGTAARLLELNGAMARTIGQLLSLAHASEDAALSEAPPRPLDLAGLIREVASEAAPGIYAAGREIEIEGAAVPVRIAGDAALLKSALRNLAENALHHGAGRIRIALGPVEGGLAIRVADEGRGVAAEALPRLGTRFFRAGARNRGSGLGLSIVERVAALHGGRLELGNLAGGGFEAVLVLPWPQSARPRGPRGP
ncbi:sensor histidine kinase [Poseidonocella sp. HB161398]|uniref:sensor histidine kinase n=1 Tax=Poseidonocella sp. HB161398 TaxID=2320855 RepID=UPI001486E305|nr:sensor histidine kinase [Poseidonocella sp. HB161398]